MKIFEKRPLCLILCIMLGGFSFSVNSTLSSQLILLAIPVLVFVLTLIKGVINQSKVLLTRIASISLLLSLLLGILFTQTFLPKSQYGTPATITAEVEEVTDTVAYQKLILEIDTINSSSCDYKFIFFNYGEKLNIGDYIKADCVIESFENDKDYRSIYYAKGICGKVELSDITVLGNTSPNKSIFIRSRESITRKLIEATNTEAGGFMSALLIGDLEYLDSSLNLSFRRLGLSHILALSGMNIALLTFAIERILLFIKVPRKRRMLATAFFTLAYMALVGFTPSITRAGVMLIIYYSLHLLAHTSDSITSLSLAVFLIICIDPTSVYDISLWLSAFATLGIVTLSEMNISLKAKGVLSSILFYFINSIISSFFAIILTLLLTVTSFNTISPISLISTAIFSPIVEIYIYLGLIMPFVGWFLPIGKLIMFITNIIKWGAELMSRPWWVSVRADHLSIKILTAVLTVAILGYLIFEVRRKKIALFSIAAILIATMAVALSISATKIYTDKVIYSSDSSYDTVISISDGDVSIITSDTVTSPNMRFISDRLNENGICKINNLVLTGYSESFNTLGTLINYIRVDIIHLPVPQNPYELEGARNISDLLSDYGTTLRFYDVDSRLLLSNVSFSLKYRSAFNLEEAYSSIFTLEKHGEIITYFSENAHSNAPDNVLLSSEQSSAWIFGVGSQRGNPYDIYLSTPDTIISGRDKRIDAEIEQSIKETTTNIKYVKDNILLFE